MANFLWLCETILRTAVKTEILQHFFNTRRDLFEKQGVGDWMRGNVVATYCFSGFVQY